MWRGAGGRLPRSRLQLLNISIYIYAGQFYGDLNCKNRMQSWESAFKHSVTLSNTTSELAQTIYISVLNELLVIW